MSLTNKSQTKYRSIKEGGHYNKVTLLDRC